MLGPTISDDISTLPTVDGTYNSNSNYYSDNGPTDSATTLGSYPTGSVNGNNDSGSYNSDNNPNGDGSDGTSQSNGGNGDGDGSSGDNGDNGSSGNNGPNGGDDTEGNSNNGDNGDNGSIGATAHWHNGAAHPERSKDHGIIKKSRLLS